MKLRSAMPGQKVMAFLLVVPFLRADDLSVFNEIRGRYDRAIRGQLTAKTPEDLDANERLIDTPD